MNITLSMLVHNEAHRHLETVLQSAREYISSAVILDDASTDHTIDVCHHMLRGIPHMIVHNAAPGFDCEWQLRRQQWRETVKTGPEWILTLDADEMFEGPVSHLPETTCAHYFRLYDMWDNEHYRDDRFWSAHHTYRPFLVKYRAGMSDTWQQTAQHCGRFPLSVALLPFQYSDVRLKHLGWSRKADRKAKYARYMRLDPAGKFGWLEQYHSILDENPNLVRF